MNEQDTSPESASNPLYRSAVVFVAGIALGALMMVEIVPASSMLDFEPLGTGPTEGATAPEGSGADTLADGGAGTPDAGAEVTGPGSTGETGDGSGTSGGEGGGTSNGDGDGGGGTGGGGGGGGDDPKAPKNSTPSGLECAAGRNGGATDPKGGVSATEIKMATTVVESGIGSSFLGETRFAMDAVKNRVNGEGGICGRQLTIEYRDDAWKQEDGQQFLRNFLNQGIFAVPVGPSSEGLNAVIKTGEFDKHQVPVVGTNGLSILQYERSAKDGGGAQPWVWPVASATVSSARIMAKDAFDRGAKEASDFSVVFASNYRFGAEGAEAFNAEVKRLTGDDIPGYKPNATDCDTSYCAVTAGATSSYSQQVGQFEEGKFVAMFLEPQTARAWMTDNNAPAADSSDIPLGFGAAQPLFTKQFGDQCGTKCHTMLVWTGFKPNQEHYVSDPDVQRYVNDLQRSNRNADPNNQFSLGAYIGMELLVEAIKAVGPELTREKLKVELDRMTFDSGLTLADPMKFSANNRYVATTMQAWEFQAVGSFSGWSAQQIVTDPKFGG